jgi:hypothetical protein
MHGTLFSALSLLILSYFISEFEANPIDPTYQNLTVVAIFVFSIFFGISMGPGPWSYNAEILNEKGK